MIVDLVQEPTPSLPESPAPRAVPAGRRRLTPRAHVVAVVVARDGAARLPRVLTALASSTRAPDALVGVDLGSADASAELLATAMPVLALPRRATFHDAVEAALALRAAGRLTHGTGPQAQGSPDADGVAPGVVEWVWLLPHDAAPAPDALEQLLLGVETAPSVGVAGCKQVAWDDDQRLLDVGFTASPLGLRVTGVDRGEVDQGQHDARSDVLAVSGAGMLVRRDVWEELGGLDPALDPAVAGDLDLCRRAHLAGRRVVVVPSAVVARATARPSRRPARHAVLHLRLSAVPAPLLPLAVAAVVALAPLRALLLVLAGRTSAAAAELAATGGVLAHPLALVRTRRRGGRARQVPQSVLRTLRPPVDQLLRQRYDAVHSWVTPPVPDVPAPPPAPRPLGALALLLLATAAAGGVLGRSLLSGATTSTASAGPAGPDGPRLPATPLDAAALWASATGTWRHVGLGARAVADPWPGLLALVAAPLGDPALAQRLLLAAAVPLAALAAWAAAGAVTRSVLLRGWAALAWAAAPPLLGAVLDGRPAAVVAHVLLPVAALAVVRCRVPGSRVWGGVARLGLVLTALLAAAPVLTVPVLLLLAGCAALPVAGEARRRWLPLLAAAVPAGLLLPWWWAVVRAPQLLLSAADGTRPAPSGTGNGTPWWHLLALPAAPDGGAPAARLAALARALGAPGWPSPSAPAAVAVVLAALVVVPAAVAAVAGALRRRGGGTAALGWAAAGLGLLLAALTLAAAEPAAVAPALSLGLAGLGLAALLGAQVLPALVRRRARSPRPARAVLAVSAVLALAGPAVALGLTAAAGTGPVGAGAGLPELAVAEARGPNAARTLVLAVDQSPARLRWAVVRGAGVVLGDASAALATRPADRDAAVVLPVLAGLLSTTGSDARPALAQLAVGSVALLAPTDPGTVLALDASPGLTRVAGTSGALLWRVDPPAGSALSRPARARVVDAATGRALLALPSSGPTREQVAAHLEPGPAGRLVVLAERHDAGWQARLDGVPLAPSRQGWAQAFVLPTRGGHLEVRHDAGVLALADPARAGLLGVALLLALPLPRLRGRAGPPRPPRPSRPLPRPAAAPDDLRPAALPQVYDDDHHPEDGARPLYIGPPPRGLRRRSRVRRRRPPGDRRPPPPGGQP